MTAVQAQVQGGRPSIEPPPLFQIQFKYDPRHAATLADLKNSEAALLEFLNQFNRDHGGNEIEVLEVDGKTGTEKKVTIKFDAPLTPEDVDSLLARLQGLGPKSK